MNKKTKKNSSSEIGRTKAVVVFNKTDNAIGVVSEIVVRISSDVDVERLIFRGPVYFKERILNHIYSIILPLVDRITEHLNVPSSNFEISIVNLGAASSIDRGIEISGFSADLPILLTLLSSSLHVPLKQDIVSTGHVSSLDGDIAPVRGISAKIDAVLDTPGVSAFVVPELEKDRSLKILTPNEYEAAKESQLAHKSDIKIHTTGNVYEAIRIFMADESIVMGSLKAGFFSVKATIPESQGPINRTVELLTEGNEKRFWNTIEHFLLSHRTEKARLLLKSYVDFFIRNQSYPERFGEELFRLVISLPPSTRRLDDLFPLFPMELYISLIQYAKTSDHKDVHQLYKAAFDKGFSDLPPPLDKPEETKAKKGTKENEIFERILSEIGEENLAEKIGQPIDEARLSYVTNSVTVKDGFEFNDAITAFYTHIFRHTGSPAGQMNRVALSAEAIDLIKKAFEHKGGYKAALSEGKHGTNGGMRLVFDSMTEYLKQEGKEKYIARVFKDTIDPLDWDGKVSLMEEFMDRIGPELPADLRGLPAKKLASHWETILQHYAESMDKVSGLLKRL